MAVNQRKENDSKPISGNLDGEEQDEGQDQPQNGSVAVRNWLEWPLACPRSSAG